MEEKKLTDKEIVKAFEVCYFGNESCSACPYEINDIDCTDRRSVKDMFDLMNRQKVEIERLAEENGQLKGYTDGLEYEVEQRQKQVDELEAEKEDLYFQNKNLQTYIDNHEPIWKRNTEQAVKDTAKEILQMLYDDRNGYWDSCDCGKDETYWRDNSIQGTLNEIKERYGVEVE